MRNMIRTYFDTKEALLPIATQTLEFSEKTCEILHSTLSLKHNYKYGSF